jgi:hypothetical protein
MAEVNEVVGMAHLLPYPPSSVRVMPAFVRDDDCGDIKLFDVNLICEYEIEDAAGAKVKEDYLLCQKACVSRDEALRFANDLAAALGVKVEVIP